MISVDVTVGGPLDMRRWAQRFVRWGEDPVARWDGTWFWCVAEREGRLAPYRARQTSARNVVVAVASPEHVAPAVTDVGHRLGEGLPRRPLLQLAGEDPTVAALVRRFRGYRPPMEPDPYAALLTAITAQQVNLAWAVTTRRRLVTTYGRRVRFDGETLRTFPRPTTLAEVPTARLRELQFTWRKSEYLVEVAAAAVAGRLDGLGAMGDEEVIASVTELRGVGRWTADWLLARCLARPRAVAAGDLGVRRAVGTLYLGRHEAASEDEVRRCTARWGDAANWVSHLLLEALARQERKRPR